MAKKPDVRFPDIEDLARVQIAIAAKELNHLLVISSSRPLTVAETAKLRHLSDIALKNKLMEMRELVLRRQLGTGADPEAAQAVAAEVAPPAAEAMAPGNGKGGGTG